MDLVEKTVSYYRDKELEFELIQIQGASSVDPSLQ